MTDLVLLPGQRRLWECVADHILYCAGVGSGKTQGGARWALKQIVEQPYAIGFIGANTFSQLHTVCIPAFKAVLEEVGLQYVFNKKPPESWGVSRFLEHDSIFSIKVPGCSQPCQVHAGSMENYEIHRGKNLGWFWLDEGRDTAEGAHNVLQSRFRGQPEGTIYRELITTTPNGFGWIYRKFVSDPMPNSAVIRAKTTENSYLPPGFIENLRAQYTEQFAKQEIDGEFLNLTSGQAYYAFNRAKHVTAISVDPLQPLFYSMDWNVSPLCAVYGMFDKSSAQFAGEVYIQGSGRTSDAAEEFNRRLTAHKNRRLIIYGDMSGANRDTRNDSTDYDILERVFKAAGWAVEIRRNYSNPPFIESVEAVNASFEHGKVTVDPSCKRLITDLEQVAWQSGTKVLDKSNKELTHMSDAARYFLFKEFSARQKAGVCDLLN